MPNCVCPVLCYVMWCPISLYFYYLKTQHLLKLIFFGNFSYCFKLRYVKQMCPGCHLLLNLPKNFMEGLY